MMKKQILFSSLLVSTMLAQAQKYPITKKVDHIDDYHGSKVADPYRWLEDDRSAETADWVKAQNQVTNGFLDQIPYRKQLFKRLEEVFNYPKISAPSRKGEFFYFYKNDGLQNQSVLYRQKGLDGQAQLVIDPNQLSSDGTTRMAQFTLSKNGKFAAIALSKGGSDWQEIKVMDMANLEFLSDKVAWVKVSGISWQGDGFYYSRYPAPAGTSELSAKNENHIVYFHKVGTAQTADELIYEDKANPQRFHGVGTSEDEQYAFLSVSDRGKGKDGEAVFYKKVGDRAFQPIVAQVGDFTYNVLEVVNGKFLISTNDKAKNSKIVLFDPQHPEPQNWKTIIAEKPEPMQSASTAGGKLFVSYLKDVTTRVYVYDLNGKLENEVTLPSLGTAGGFGGDRDDKFVFYSFSSFSSPSTIYRYDIASKKSSIFRELTLKFKPTDFETKQVFYPSKDGTKIPMFIVYKKGIKLDSSNPTLLYGYGGFNISLVPQFSATLIPFLEQGGVYASANLRGGAEYGERWHEQGMKLKKQNVFDDFIAAGEWLIANKYCSSKTLAIRGGSNGGLLVGAVMNQRPNLASVAIPQVGVMDMLRFQKFTIGWNWIADYGSSDNLQEFKYLAGYSPIHNINETAKYPATLITTADHDDRVVPAHSFKYAAVLQEKAGKNTDKPLLIRIDTNSGHGASNTTKNLELTADIYSFIFWNMGYKTLK